MRPPDRSLTLTAAVAARSATDAFIGTYVPVAAPTPHCGHIAAVPLDEHPADRRPLCDRPNRSRGLHPVDQTAARLLPLCNWCRTRLAATLADVAPSRWERAAYYAAAITAAARAQDTQAREDAITAAIGATTPSVIAVLGQWIPGSTRQVPLHALIAMWRDQGALRAWEDELRAQPLGRYRNGRALTGTGARR